MKKLKIFNDPIYGFIPIQSILIFDIIEHPYFQRLRRISQMGLSYLVYPGVHHTRFEHALGCLYLMEQTVTVLKSKNVKISKHEKEALLIAILLHDIGHGPFSHTLEHSIVTDNHHEAISLQFMEALNVEFDGKLSLAIKIFKGEYERPFFNQLIASQLDIDRLDYLKRDSFFSGVTEGNINSHRLITMLDVVDDNLVVDKKGIYSVEKFIVARRLMYWMVYLHKTSLAAECILVNILKRAKELSVTEKNIAISSNLNFFLNDAKGQPSETLKVFSKLDDYDVISSIKTWMEHSDKVLSTLSKDLINRNLPKVVIQNTPFSKEQRQHFYSNCNEEIDQHYFVHVGTVKNLAYNKEKYPINIRMKGSKIANIISVSDHLNLETLTQPVIKHFAYYPK